MKNNNLKLIPFLFIAFTVLYSCRVSENLSHLNKKDIQEYDSINYINSLIEGQKQLMLGNYKLASILLKDCNKYLPTASVPYYSLATMEYHLGNFKQAKIYIDSAIQKNDTNKWYFNLLQAISMEIGDYSGVITTTKKLIDLNPEEIRNYSFLANIYIQNKEYEKAIQQFNNIEKINGFNANIRLEKIKLYDLLNQNEKAKEELLNLINLYPNTAYYYGLLAEFYVEQIDYEKALAAYNKVEELDPENGLIHMSLFEFYNRIGDNSMSLKELEKALVKDDVPIENKMQALLNLDKIYRIDSIEKTKERLVKLLSNKYPNEYRIKLLKVEKLLQDKQYNDARDILAEIVDSVKNNFFVWQQLIIVESYKEDYNNMLLECNEALNLFPNQPVFYLFSGIANYNLKNYEEAINVLKSGIDFALNNIEIRKQIYTYIGEAYYKLEKDNQAFDYFDKTIALDSNNTYVLNNYSYYLALQNKKLDKAAQMMKKCVSINDTSSSYLDTYAWVLYKLKEYNAALVYIRMAYENGGSTSSVITEHYGDILYKNGEEIKAVEKWNEAKKLGSISKNLLRKIEEKRIINNEE
ncbi:MAG: hypothetical protein GXO79_04625 [Chlorobi bacterium]|nr:hypothetical protein [Chlorobiota bacterium]